MCCLSLRAKQFVFRGFFKRQHSARLAFFHIRLYVSFKVRERERGGNNKTTEAKKIEVFVRQGDRRINRDTEIKIEQKKKNRR